ncbi:MAG: hypothetical protein HYS53_00175 [Candidatus Aenigmarchaeota archaeon]|nr:hypothetical protein [Candidatus Aenigmarchaeota archaeon]
MVDDSTTPRRDEFLTEEIGTQATDDKDNGIRIKLHVKEEDYFHYRSGLTPIKEGPAKRHYVVGKPYVLLLETSRTAKFNRRTGLPEIVETPWEGMLEAELGNAQAWYYPADRKLILWECLLNDRLSKVGMLPHPRFGLTWKAFEDHLTTRFSPKEIYTPGWEPMFKKDVWKQFLRGMGYQQAPDPSAMMKIYTHQV